MDVITHCLTPGLEPLGIRSLIGVGIPVRDPSPFSALPPKDINRGYTSIYFGENQLFPSLIDLSSLTTVHPTSFQR
jgi:hypothetical protein